MLLQEKDFLGFIAGHEKSFEVIFRQYYPTLVSFAMRFGVKEMEAEDIVIETMYHIWEIRKDVKSAAALHVLFYTVVRNRVLTLLRDLRNHNRIIGKQQTDLTDLETERAFYERIRQEELGYLWNKAMEELPPQCRRVVLALLKGKTVAEIAEEMKISVSSVKTYKTRSIEILRKIFKNYPYMMILILIRLGY